MAMVVDVGALATTAAAAVVCKCKYGVSSSTSCAPSLVGMGAGHTLPVSRGLRRVNMTAKRFEPVGFQARSSGSIGIVAEVQEAASPGW